MFGHDAQPTRVYAYGARVDESSLAAVHDQLRAAHHYRNRLVEIELERRAANETILRSLSPELYELSTAILTSETELEALQVAAKAERSSKRSRLVVGDTGDKLRTTKAALAQQRARQKELRQQLFASEAFKSQQIAVDAANKAALKQAHSASGVYWATYLIVDRSAQDFRRGAPPKFRRQDGNGRIAVQFQGGAPAEEVLEISEHGNPHLQIDNTPDPDRRNPWRRARIRIGSTGAGGRTPVWADLHVKLHRLPPPGTSIKWAILVARRVGTHTKWSLQLSLADPAGWQVDDRAPGGRVAVDVGWRKLTSIRVAYWLGDDGQSGEVTIPPERLDRVRKVSELQSIRDQHFDAVKATLRSYMESLGSIVPDWLQERLATLMSWRSPARLAAAVHAWRAQRFDGDAVAYEAVEAWRLQDKHLYDWQEHQRAGEQAWRQNLYRNVAAQLSRRYRTVVIEDTDWTTFQRKPEIEDDTGEFEREDVFRRTAAVSHLLGALKHRMTECVRVPAQHTTQRCHACGSIENFDAAAELTHTCGACGAVWDQDRNACINMLARCPSVAMVAV